MSTSTARCEHPAEIMLPSPGHGIRWLSSYTAAGEHQDRPRESIIRIQFPPRNTAFQVQSPQPLRHPLTAPATEAFWVSGGALLPAGYRPVALTIADNFIWLWTRVVSREISMMVYRHGDTYIAPKGSFFDGNVKIEGNFITPPWTHIWGNMIVSGRLELGPGSTVGGFVEAESAIIGHDARIKGLPPLYPGRRRRHTAARGEGRGRNQRRDDLRLWKSQHRTVTGPGREGPRPLTPRRDRAGRHPSTPPSRR